MSGYDESVPSGRSSYQRPAGVFASGGLVSGTFPQASEDWGVPVAAIVDGDVIPLAERFHAIFADPATYRDIDPSPFFRTRQRPAFADYERWKLTPEVRQAVPWWARVIGWMLAAWIAVAG